MTQVVLIGRQGVGKSTIFKLLVGKSLAKRSEYLPTRDRDYRDIDLNGISLSLVDTGGLYNDAEQPLARQITEQALQAASTAGLIILVLDHRSGITYEDLAIAKSIRKYAVPKIVLLNHASDSTTPEEYFKLGIKDVCMINKSITTFHKELTKFLYPVVQDLPIAAPIENSANNPRMAILGRPNVGKSTLINQLLGEQRIITSNIPGTTTATVEIPFSFDRQDFTLIDTAGIRRKAKISDATEISMNQHSLGALRSADIVVYILDITQGLVDQDMKMLGQIIEQGKPLVIAINKIDLLSQLAIKSSKADITKSLHFVSHVPIKLISAATKTSLQSLLKQVHGVWSRSQINISTSMATKIMQHALDEHPPGKAFGHIIKPRYAHIGKLNPHTIIIHGARVSKLNRTYLKYLSNYFYKQLDLLGIQLKIVTKDSK